MVTKSLVIHSSNLNNINNFLPFQRCPWERLCPENRTNIYWHGCPATLSTGVPCKPRTPSLMLATLVLRSPLRPLLIQHHPSDLPLRRENHWPVMCQVRIGWYDISLLWRSGEWQGFCWSRYRCEVPEINSCCNLFYRHRFMNLRQTI